MYNTKFECRYHKNDVILDTDDVTEQEIHFIRNYLYKEDLLTILNIDYGDGEDIFENSMTELYEIIKDSEINLIIFNKEASKKMNIE